MNYPVKLPQNVHLTVPSACLEVVSACHLSAGYLAHVLPDMERVPSAHCPAALQGVQGRGRLHVRTLPKTRPLLLRKLHRAGGKLPSCLPHAHAINRVHLRGETLTRADRPMWAIIEGMIEAGVVNCLVWGPGAVTVSDCGQTRGLGLVTIVVEKRLNWVMIGTCLGIQAWKENWVM